MASRPQPWPAVLLTALARGVLAFVAGLALWASAPALFGWTPHVVLSGSMAPRIEAGDVVLTAGVRPASVRRGQVIAFREPGAPDRTVLHRAVRREPDGSLVTRGDANASADPWRVRPDDVVGLGRLRVPLVGLPALWLHRGQWAWLLASALVVAGAGFLAVRDHGRPRRRHSRAGAGTAAALAGTLLLLVPAAHAPARAAFTAATDGAGNAWTAAPYLVGPGQYVPTVQADSPVLFYRLNDAAGPTATDLSGNGNQGSYGAGWAYGVTPQPLPRNPGTAVAGNGTSTCVTTAYASLALATFSLEVWFRAGTGQSGTLAEIGTTAGALAAIPFGTLSVTSAGTVSLRVASVGTATITTPGTYTDGRWHHAVATMTAGANGMHLYVDGVAQATGNPPTISLSVAPTVRFGCTLSGLLASPSAVFGGALADPAAYAAVLGAARVATHYWAA